MYGIVMWCSNNETLKKYIEDIAKNEYKKERNPMDCLLWYLVL
jgi:hypothetical protein